MLTTDIKDQVLSSLIQLINKNKQAILQVNAVDVSAYQGSDESMLDRLKVNKEKIAGMVSAIKKAIDLEDPEGKILYHHAHENGMDVKCKTVPFGTILIIYESRPDVTIEAAITAFKAGNKILLKGGKEAVNTNLLLTDLWKMALQMNAVNLEYVIYLDLPRKETQRLIRENTHDVDLIIPRGGEGLIQFVQQNTTIPTIVSGRGNNFMYIDVESDFSMATKVALNGKSRISVCNALDKVLLDSNISGIEEKTIRLVEELISNGITVMGDQKLVDLSAKVKLYEEETILAEEFLAKKILLKIVNGMDEAILVINKNSGKHSAVIISSNENHAETFLHEVDCAAVYHNASTRFTDGGQFGFGAEMAISTQKSHFRGPIGIDQLVTNKWFIKGDGQIR